MAEAPPTPRAPLPRNVWVATAASFLTDASSEMLHNSIPLFLVNVLGAGTAMVGLIEGVAESTASLLKLASGYLSDRFRNRKWLAVLGYGVSTAAKPFLYFATTGAGVLGLRFAERFGKGIRTAPRDALIADCVDERCRGAAFGLHRAGDTAGALVGLAIALAIVLAAQRGGAVLTRHAFRMLVIGSSVPAVLAVLVLALGIREPRSPARTAAPPKLSLAGFDRRFRFFLVIVVLFTLGNSSDAFLILRAQNVGLSLPGIFGMLLTMNLVYALVARPAGSLSDRFGRRRFLIVGWLVYAAVYAGFSRASAGWHAWALMGAYGLYYGLTEGVAKAFVADLVPPERRGTAYGVYHAAVGITALPASLIAGLLWQGAGRFGGLGPGAPFVFGGALALAASAMLAALTRGGARGTMTPDAQRRSENTKPTEV
ncbi:MAG: MFS transporter [Candidatus Eisenbacteria bacterium]|nr:MFS transporter [Candidatus Eisenbacteria bacterium]